jgi:GAF domain-containing protein
MESHRLAGFLKDGVERFQALTETIRIDIEDINLSLPPLPSASPEQTGGEGPTAVLPVITKESEDVTRLRLRYQVLEEINKALISRLPVNEILGMVMEGIYRGIGFDRAVFGLVNPQRTEVRGRLGLGEDVEEMISLLYAQLTPNDNILAQALIREKEFLINPQAKPKDRDAMSDEFWRVSRAKTFFVSPVLINGVPMGIFYVDRLSPNTPITVEDIQLLQTFRNLTILAFESRRK